MKYGSHILRAVSGFATGYIMYRNLAAAIACMVVFTIYGFMVSKDIKKAAKDYAGKRFLVFLSCLEPLLKSSGTFNRAFAEAAEDYRKIHGADQVYKVLAEAEREFRLNAPTSEILAGMAGKLDISDAGLFAGSIAICESTGGNMVDVTRNTAGLLAGKMRVKRDIGVILAGRKMEQRIISVMPVIILGILSLTSGDYLEPIYETAVGRIVMSAAGLLFAAEWFICKRISDVEV